MLKQIKTLGLSLVIGSMLVTSLPVYNNDCYAMTRTNISDMTEEDRVVEMYKYMCNNVYGEECTDKEETMVRKYFKYRTIKELAYRDAEEWQKEKEFQSNNDYIGTEAAISPLEISTSCLEEIFPNIEKMNSEQQRVLTFMYAYKFNRHLNVKNTINLCIDNSRCSKEYVSDKYAEMLGVGNVCGEHHNAPVSKLSGAGAKAAYMRSTESRNATRDRKVKIVKETDKIVVLEDSYFHNTTMTNRTKTITFDKETRTIISEVNNYEE